MPQYLALLFGDPAREPAPGTPEFDADMALHERFGEIAGAAILGGEALEPGTASVVRPGPDGAPLVTTGPFPEGTEVVGGYYVLEADDLDGALDLARQIPVAAYGSVEVRPLVEWSPPAGPPAAGLQRHLALIWAAEGPSEVPGTPEWEAGAAEHSRFGERHGAALSSGAALHPAATATVVRVRDGEVLVTDGPFSEGAEVVGGFYVLATADRDEAEAVAAAIPISTGGAVELHRVMEVDG